MKDESSSMESDEDSGEILMEFDESSGEWEISGENDFDFIYDLWFKDDDAADKTL